MKVKTNALIGPALDWAVATCEGGVWQPPSTRAAFWIWPTDPVRYSLFAPAYSTDWSQGGPIIERENMHVGPRAGYRPAGIQWTAEVPGTKYAGPTMLIAAMHCYVASKLGDEVDVPKELL